MPINILMPALSPTMEKGNLAKWLKKEGDAVKTGDVIAEIETDKATMEYEAVDDGVMAKIVVPEGTADVAVNQLIAVMAQEGEDVKQAAADAGKGAAAPKAPAAARRNRPLRQQLRRRKQNRPRPRHKHRLRSPRRRNKSLPSTGTAEVRAAIVSSPRRWHGVSPRMRASSLAVSRAPARTAV